MTFNEHYSWKTGENKREQMNLFVVSFLELQFDNEELSCNLLEINSIDLRRTFICMILREAFFMLFYQKLFEFCVLPFRHVYIQLFQFTLSDQSFNPTRQDRMVIWVFTGICISVKMKITSFYFCAWSLNERGANVVALRSHLPVAFLPPSHSFKCLNSS